MNWKEFFTRRSGQLKRPNLFEEMKLGAEAQQLRESAAYTRALERMRIAIHEAWGASPLEDKDGQHELRLMLKVLDQFEAHIKDEAETGLMAKQQQENEKRKVA